MNKIQREDLYIINQHSNLSTETADSVLNENIYTKRADWQKFLQILFITLGVGFTVAGIIFFFAYNWAYLHKFVKLGLIVSLLIITVAITLIPKLNPLVKNIVLTGASMLVGALFAVFGQVYQTGANAYDFFLAWTIFISIWVFISNFPPLTLVYITLINTTFILYNNQVADWKEQTFILLLFVINTVALINCLAIRKIEKPKWFTNILTIAVATYATIGNCMGITSSYHPSFAILFGLTSILYAGGILYALKNKQVFYLAIMAFSILIILSAFLVHITDNEMMFFFLFLLNTAGISLTVKLIIDLQKRWKNEN